MPAFEVKNTAAQATQFDGTVAGAIAVQAALGDGQAVTFLQRATAGAAPTLSIQDTKTHTFQAAAVTDWVVVDGSGAVRVLKADAFAAAYKQSAA